MAHGAAYQLGRGWQVENVSRDGRGYDLLSRDQGGAVRYIEVKGRAGVGAVELSANEWLKAEQLGEDYWLCFMTDALSAPPLYLNQDPARRPPGGEVLPQLRYRVTEEGWNPVADLVQSYRMY